jgi:hypothetical protein
MQSQAVAAQARQGCSCKLDKPRFKRQQGVLIGAAAKGRSDWVDRPGKNFRRQQLISLVINKLYSLAIRKCSYAHH